MKKDASITGASFFHIYLISRILCQISIQGKYIFGNRKDSRITTAFSR